MYVVNKRLNKKQYYLTTMTFYLEIRTQKNIVKHNYLNIQKKYSSVNHFINNVTANSENVNL